MIFWWFTSFSGWYPWCCDDFHRIGYSSHDIVMVIIIFLIICFIFWWFLSHQLIYISPQRCKIFWWLSSYFGKYPWCYNDFSVDGHHIRNYFYNVDDFQVFFFFFPVIFDVILVLTTSFIDNDDSSADSYHNFYDIAMVIIIFSIYNFIFDEIQLLLFVIMIRCLSYVLFDPCKRLFFI